MIFLEALLRGGAVGGAFLLECAVGGSASLGAARLPEDGKPGSGCTTIPSPPRCQCPIRLARARKSHGITTASFKKWLAIMGIRLRFPTK
jgi:hypothetical protein